MNHANSQLHSFPARRKADRARPPLLFVHGGYVNALCWQPHFIPYFQDLGYDCHAIDLSGHGSARLPDMDGFGLDDYADDVARAVAELDGRPVLIGHSMGCAVVQRYLGHGAAVAVAFLSPVPPSGTLGSAARLATHWPDFLVELPKAAAGEGDAHTAELMAEIYFAPDMPREEALTYLPMLQPESQRAVLDMVDMPLRPVRARPRIPALVMGGACDQVFAADMLGFTAATWEAEKHVIPGAGHMLMLDPQWPEAARTLADWLAPLPALAG